MESRIFYSPEIETLNELSEEESLHCQRVLRLGIGDEIMITDGKGSYFRSVISAIEKKRCKVDVLERIPWVKTWRNRIHIAIAPTKNIDRVEWLVEKMAEVGFDELTFLDCRYSERHIVKMERIEKILVSAIKQSQKALLPKVNAMVAFSDFIASEHVGKKYIAHCHDGEKIFLPEINLNDEEVLVMIGPEGDFSVDEVNNAVKAGYVPISLGASRLRTETAALVACVIVNMANQSL